jgi:hypothetical protein
MLDTNTITATIALDYDPICDECGSIVIDEIVDDRGDRDGEPIRMLYCSNPCCESHNLM